MRLILAVLISVKKTQDILEDIFSNMCFNNGNIFC